MSTTIFNFRKIIISLILIVAFYIIFLIISDLQLIIQAYENVDWYFILVILGISLSVISIKGLIQKKLLSDLGVKISWKESIMLYYAGLSMVLTPGGAGLLIKSYFLKKLNNTQTSKTVPLVIAERFYDLLADLILVSISLLFFLSLEASITIVLYIIIITVFLLVIKKSLFFFKLQNILKKIPIINRIIVLDSELLKNLPILFSWKIFSFMVITISCITFYESIIFFFSFQAFNVNLDFFQVIQIFYSSLLLGAISFIPGGIGPMEAIFANMLYGEGIVFSTSASIIIFIRLLTLWVPSGIGALVAYFKFIRTS